MLNLIHGDCLGEVKKLLDNSVDSIITDPPYEIGFMGKSWDKTGVANNVDLWRELLRVLKPGGHLLAFSGTRSYHRMACAIEDAGFEVRDMIEWVYGSGFPKSLNIGKAIQKSEGVELEDTGIVSKASRPNVQQDLYESGKVGKSFTLKNVTTQNAKQWEGWGTALKPAHEPICMARKPLESTVAKNCLQWGVGGLNIDASRVGTAGRFPSNLIHDGSEEVLSVFPHTSSGKMLSTHTRHTDGSPNGIYGAFDEEHPLAETYGDSGSAARFFKSILYQPKANKTDREGGNNHPTVKPTALMRYLCVLITPKAGVILDPFMGSGSTGKAALLDGYSFVGIEKEQQYFEIAKKRLDGALEK